MNYRERMRKAVECPQFGNIDYGEWGALNLNQRIDIKRLLDEMDRADEYIKTLYFKNMNLQSKLDKANEWLDKNTDWKDFNCRELKFDENSKPEELKDILKENRI